MRMPEDRFLYSSENCSIRRTLDVVGEKWTILVLREAFYGVRRFDDFARAIGCARNILSARLGTLVEEGLLERQPYRDPGARSRVEYRLTDKGRDAYTVLAAMAAWGDRWLVGPEGTPLVLHHTACDHDMHAVVVCSECAEAIDVREVRALPGPGAPTVTTPR
jgi:DNA-binding HxlR family transcriptional regulator